MGKYRASLIHEWWSDWHYQRTKNGAWMADVDDIATEKGNVRRIWNEMRSNGIILAIELKWFYAIKLERDSVTTTEQQVMNFYETHGVPYYVFAIDALREKPEFHIFRPFVNANRLAKLSEDNMIEWINSDYKIDFLNSKIMCAETQT